MGSALADELGQRCLRAVEDTVLCLGFPRPSWIGCSYKVDAGASNCDCKQVAPQVRYTLVASPVQHAKTLVARLHDPGFLGVAAG